MGETDDHGSVMFIELKVCMQKVVLGLFINLHM